MRGKGCMGMQGDRRVRGKGNGVMLTVTNCLNERERETEKETL